MIRLLGEGVRSFNMPFNVLTTGPLLESNYPLQATDSGWITMRLAAETVIVWYSQHYETAASRTLRTFGHMRRWQEGAIHSRLIVMETRRPLTPLTFLHNGATVLEVVIAPGGGKESRQKTTRDERKEWSEEMKAGGFCPHCFRYGAEWHEAANCHRGGPMTPKPKSDNKDFWSKEEAREALLSTSGGRKGRGLGAKA